MIKIVLGSTSEIKRQALEDACRALAVECEIICIDAASGVNPQPVGEEAGKGARNRALAGRALHPDAYAIGIESGLTEVGDLEPMWVDQAVIGVIMPDGQELSGVTAETRVPAVAANAARSTAWKSTVGAILARQHGSSPWDPHSFLSGGKQSRRDLLAAALRSLLAKTLPLPNTHRLQIGRTVRHLPIREVVPGVKVALFNLLGDWELVEAAGVELAKRVPKGVEALIMPDGKAQALLHVMGRESRLPTGVIRKERKPYMGERVLSVQVKSITTDRLQSLFLSEDDAKGLDGTRVAIVDDVVSSGGTLEAVKELLAKAGAIHVATMAVLTEGQKREDVISLDHLPLY